MRKIGRSKKSEVKCSALTFAAAGQWQPGGPPKYIGAKCSSPNLCGLIAFANGRAEIFGWISAIVDGKLKRSHLQKGHRRNPTSITVVVEGSFW